MESTNWELQQQKTFVDWTNYFLKKHNKESFKDMQDLLEKDGILTLLETIYENVKFKKTKSSSPFMRLENYNKALNVCGQPYGVVAIDLVFKKDLKMATTFVWHIIQKYNISKYSLAEKDRSVVFESNDPNEPITYWENDIEDDTEKSDFTKEKSLKDITNEWVKFEEKDEDSSDKIDIDDLLYFTGEFDRRVINFAKFLTIFDKVKVDVPSIEKDWQKDTSIEHALKIYLLLQEKLYDAYGVPIMSLIFPVEGSSGCDKFQLNEQAFLSYLCSVRDCVAKAVEPKIQSEVAIEEIEDEEEDDEDLIQELDKKINSQDENSDPLTFSFEEFVNYLEPELRPLAMQLKHSYEIRITQINEHMEIIKMQELQRKQRDEQRKMRQKMKLLVKKQKYEAEQMRIQQDYIREKNILEMRENYIRKQNEIKSMEASLKKSRRMSIENGMERLNIRSRSHGVKNKEEKAFSSSSSSSSYKNEFNEGESLRVHKSASKHKRKEKSSSGHASSKQQSSSSSQYSSSQNISSSHSHSNSTASNTSGSSYHSNSNASNNLGSNYHSHSSASSKSGSSYHSHSSSSGRPGAKRMEIVYLKGNCKRCSEDHSLELDGSQSEFLHEYQLILHKQKDSFKVRCDNCHHSYKLRVCDKEEGQVVKENSGKNLRTLRVVVLGCKDLPPKHFLSSPGDPFVTLNFQGQMKRTNIVNGSLSPKYNKTFEFDLGDHLIEQSILNLSVRDDNGNKFMGSKELKLKEILNLTNRGEIKYKGRFELVGGKGAVIGLVLELE